jgi:hypothetical protein
METEDIYPRLCLLKKHNAGTQKGNMKQHKINFSQNQLDLALGNVSPHRFKGITNLNKKWLIPHQEIFHQKTKNWLVYLKHIQDQDSSEFVHLCSSYKVNISDFSQPRKVDF